MQGLLLINDIIGIVAGLLIMLIIIQFVIGLLSCLLYTSDAADD